MTDTETTRTGGHAPRHSAGTGGETPAGVDPHASPEYASDLIVEVLRGLGVRYLPLNPGSSFRGLHDSLVNYGGNHDPQLLLCLHEETAVSLAHGYAKATGGLAVCAVHDLVGLMHASMAVYDAFCDRTPVLVLGGSGPADQAARRSIDWIHSATTQAQLVRDFVVWDAEPLTAADAPVDVMRAVQHSLSAPRGPSYVSLDSAVQESAIQTPMSLPEPAAWRPAPPMAAEPASLRAAADLLAGAAAPAIVGGRVGHQPDATPLLVHLAELVGATYVDDANVVCFPSEHDLNLTGEASAISEADVLLAVDVPNIPALLRPGGRGARGAAEVGRGSGPAVIDLSTGDLGLRSWSNAFATPVRRTVQLLADPLLGLRQLIDVVRPLVDRDRVAARAATVAARHEALMAVAAEHVQQRWDDTPISPQRLVAETWNAVRDEAWLLCLRNTRTWPLGVWQFDGAGQYLGHSGGGGVGYGPGAFVGGALAARDAGRLGVGIVGDGDLLMASGALWTAAHYDVPMLMVVNDNGSFFNDEPHQTAVAQMRGREPGNSWIGMRIAGPRIDIAQLAASYGCWSAGPVEDPGDLADALGDAVAAALAGRCAVVHVRTATA